MRLIVQLKHAVITSAACATVALQPSAPMEPSVNERKRKICEAIAKEDQPAQPEAEKCAMCPFVKNAYDGLVPHPTLPETRVCIVCSSWVEVHEQWKVIAKTSTFRERQLIVDQARSMLRTSVYFEHAMEDRKRLRQANAAVDEMWRPMLRGSHF